MGQKTQTESLQYKYDEFQEKIAFLIPESRIQDKYIKNINQLSPVLVNELYKLYNQKFILSNRINKDKNQEIYLPVFNSSQKILEDTQDHIISNEDFSNIIQALIDFNDLVNAPPSTALDYAFGKRNSYESDFLNEVTLFWKVAELTEDGEILESSNDILLYDDLDDEQQSFIKNDFPHLAGIDTIIQDIYQYISPSLELYNNITIGNFPFLKEALLEHTFYIDDIPVKFVRESLAHFPMGGYETFNIEIDLPENLLNSDIDIDAGIFELRVSDHTANPNRIEVDSTTEFLSIVFGENLVGKYFHQEDYEIFIDNDTSYEELVSIVQETIQYKLNNRSLSKEQYNQINPYLEIIKQEKMSTTKNNNQESGVEKTTQVEAQGQTENFEQANTKTYQSAKEYFQDYIINPNIPLNHKDIYAFFVQGGKNSDLANLLSEILAVSPELPRSLTKSFVIDNIVRPIRDLGEDVQKTFKQKLENIALIKIEQRQFNEQTNIKSEVRDFDKLYEKVRADIKVNLPLSHLDIFAFINAPDISSFTKKEYLKTFGIDNINLDIPHTRNYILQNIVYPINQNGKSLNFKTGLEYMYKNPAQEPATKQQPPKEIAGIPHRKYTKEDFTKFYENYALNIDTNKSVSSTIIYAFINDTGIPNDLKVDLLNNYSNRLREGSALIDQPEQLYKLPKSKILSTLVYPLKENDGSLEEEFLFDIKTTLVESRLNKKDLILDNKITEAKVINQDHLKVVFGEYQNYNQVLKTLNLPPLDANDYSSQAEYIVNVLHEINKTESNKAAFKSFATIQEKDIEQSESPQRSKIKR